MTIGELDALADAMRRSRNYVVNEALGEYIATWKWQIECIQAGIKAAGEGHVQKTTQVIDVTSEHDCRHHTS